MRMLCVGGMRDGEYFDLDGERRDWTLPIYQKFGVLHEAHKDYVAPAALETEVYVREQIRGKDRAFYVLVHHAKGDPRCLVEMLIEGYRRPKT